MYVVSIVAYRITRIDVDLTKEGIEFSHKGLNAHAHNIVQEVEVHGLAAFCIEELTILCCSFFDSCS